MNACAAPARRLDAMRCFSRLGWVALAWLTSCNAEKPLIIRRDEPPHPVSNGDVDDKRQHPSEGSDSHIPPALLALDNFCRDATGQGLSSKTWSCECKTADGSEGIFTTSADTCVRPRVAARRCTQDSGELRSLLLDGPSADAAACLRDVITLKGHLLGSPHVTFTVEEKTACSGDTRADFTAWAGSRLRAGSGFPAALWVGTHATDSIVYHLGRLPPEDVDAAIVSLLEPQLFPLTLTQFTTHYIEPDVSILDMSLGTWSPSTDQRTATLAEAGPGTHDVDIKNAVHASFARFVTSFVDLRVRRADALDDEGCLSTCRLTSEPLPMGNGLAAALERVYSLGSVAREVIWIRRGEEIVAAALLTPGRLVGLILIMHHTVGINSIETELRAYDRLWNLQGKRAFIHPAPQEALSRMSRQSPTSTGIVGPAGPTLGICEASLATVAFASSLAKNLLLGPFTAVFDDGRFRRGSYFGWHENGSGEINNYGASLHDLRHGFLPNPFREASRAPAHGAAVLQAALEEEENLQFVPLGGQECFASAKDWMFTVGSVSRVVNASLGQYLSRSECQRMFGIPFAQTRKTLLWVVPAGNDGLEDSSEECPAALAGLSNLVVVASSTGDALSRRANFGLRTADLAARGHVGSHEGSSFAAPRVAAVAASLANQRPELSVSDIRMVLLASSRMTPGLRAAVRSGGILDGPAAMRLSAALITVREDASLRNAELSVQLAAAMHHTRFPADFVTEKLQLLAARGAF